jgi:NodT family efflux transporter outer membrane factor (OMF) lipoprotein
MNRLRALLLGILATAAGGCAVGPDYRRPDVEKVEAYKELGDWQPSNPADGIDRGAWWNLFADPELDQLERQVDISNQNVRAAVAAYDQARALVRESRSSFWPTVGATGSRQRTNEVVTTPGSTTRGATSVTSTTDTAGLNASWDIDVWGQLRRTFENSKSSAQASAAALAAARLSAQATLASDYFQLRAQDQLQRLLDDTVHAQQQSLKITESRYHYGVAAKADVVSAQAQLLSSQSQQVNARVQRAVLEHAIAVLVGRQPGNFSIAPAALRTDVPTVPPGVPSTLLERRPDIAQAERKMAAANAEIGVAVSSYFPSLTLAAALSYQGNTISHLITTPNRVWSFGPELALSVFDGGLRRAQVAQARGAYEASVATYRQTVLAAFQQVEDEVSTLRILQDQAAVEVDAVRAAREAEALTLDQYKAGTVPYSSVIAAQTTTLSSEQTALTVLSDRLQASVNLISALGGGWTTRDLP